MGISKFKDIIEDDWYEETDLSEFKNTILVVDTFSIIYKHINTLKEIKESDYIYAITNFTIMLIKKNILPIYVFDNLPPEIKKETIMKRRVIKNQNKEKFMRENDIKYYKKSISINNTIIKKCKYILDRMSIPYIQAPIEADSQCAGLTYCENIAGVIGEDYDILIFGAKTLLKNVSVNKKIKKLKLETVLKKFGEKINNIRKKYELEEIENINHENLIDFVLLIGTDYTPKIENISVVKLLEIFAVNNIDINCTINYLIENGYVIPKNFIFKITNAKEYFLHTKVQILISIEDYMFKLNDENIEKLKTTLEIDCNFCSKYVNSVCDTLLDYKKEN
jgi:flap endonuclease-1